jgi:hypothetical protein
VCRVHTSARLLPHTGAQQAAAAAAAAAQRQRQQQQAGGQAAGDGSGDGAGERSTAPPPVDNRTWLQKNWLIVLCGLTMVSERGAGEGVCCSYGRKGVLAAAVLAGQSPLEPTHLLRLCVDETNRCSTLSCVAWRQKSKAHHMGHRELSHQPGLLEVVMRAARALAPRGSGARDERVV